VCLQKNEGFLVGLVLTAMLLIMNGRVWADGPPSLPSGIPTDLVQIELDRQLFNDKRLSADGSTACATCHDADKGFTDLRPTSQGIRNHVGKRNAPTVLNAMFLDTQFLDGRAASLEEQAKLPIVNPIE
jgi:cytochrome c peroxidase